MVARAISVIPLSCLMWLKGSSIASRHLAKLPLDAPYMLELKKCIEETAEGERVFPYCGKTGYNIVRRAFKYPHLFRLSRIAKFLVDGYTIAQVRSWTGLSLAALEYYVGIVDTQKMGDSLAKVVRRN